MTSLLEKRSGVALPDNKKSNFARLESALNWLLFALLFGVALVCVGLPGDWTRNLKRHYQDVPYFWLAFGYVAVYAGATLWFWRRPEAYFNRRWWLLIGLVLLPNLLNIWLRFTLQTADSQPLFGRDADVGLFYKYGHDFATGQPPTYKGNPMEYPQGALFLFWVAERLARGDQETFYLTFPLVMLVWHLVAAGALYGIGLKLGRPRPAFLLAAFSAGSPFLLQFNYTRYDIAPAAMLLLTLYSFLPGGSEGFRLPSHSAPRGAGFWTALGFLTKWLPVIAAPFLAMAWLQTRRWKSLAWFVSVSLVISGAVMLPFYLADSYAFLYPYKWQGSRHLQGESLWYLLQYFFLDPAKDVPLRPWGEPKQFYLDNNLIQLFQIALVGLVFGAAWWGSLRNRHWNNIFDTWAAGGALAIAIFTLTNRVFSPQYLVLIAWALAVAFLLRPIGRFSLILFFGAVTFLGYCNFMVFHLAAFQEQWIPNSVKFFGLGLFLFGWLLWRIAWPPKRV